MLNTRFFRSTIIFSSLLLVIIHFYCKTYFYLHFKFHFLPDLVLLCIKKMPSGSYQVTQKPNTAQNNDQSYRNCVITMVLFIMMCVIIILATWPWKKNSLNNNYNNAVSEDDNYNSEEYVSDNDFYKNNKSDKFERLEEILENTTMFSVIAEVSEGFEKNEYIEDNATSIRKTEFSSTTSNLLNTNTSAGIETSSSLSNNFIGFSTPSPIEILETSSSGDIGTSSSESNDNFTSFSTPSPVELLETSSSGDIGTSSSESNDNFTSFSSLSPVELLETSSSGDIEISSSVSYEDSSVSNNNSSTESIINTSEDYTESGGTEETVSDDTTVTPSPSEGYSTIKKMVYFYFGSTYTEELKTTFEGDENKGTATSTLGPSITNEAFDEDAAESIKISTANPNDTIVYTTKNSLLENKIISSEKTITELSDEEQESPVCMSGQCKQLSSKILSYMNHSANPCDDFYEYACGGMESDPQISNVDLSMQVLERIKNSIKKFNHHPEYLSFTKYVDSCMRYDDYSTKNERIVQAKNVLSKIGKFYTASNWENNFHLTQLIANMILHNNPILFDIVPDVNEMNPKKFILSLRPPDNLSKYLNYTSCVEDIDDLTGEIDLEELYSNYKSCKNNTRKLHNSVTKALKEFDIFEEFYSLDNITEYINEIVIDINYQVIKALFSNYPPDSEIRAAYESKDYGIITLSDLEDHSKLLNWTKLISIITGMTFEPHDELQIYFKNNIFNALNTLENFGKTHLRELNNALLGLYARNLYIELVESTSFKDLENYCYNNAMNYLPIETSYIYISSFSENELNYTSSMIQKIFIELKETLRLNFEKLEWTNEEGRAELIQKLEGLKISIPDISYFNNSLQLIMTDDYFNNTIILMKHSRREMYNTLEIKPSNPEQLWTYFAKPYQSSFQTLYGLNLILVPLGAIDWTSIKKYDQTFDYLILSNVGNLIAREIANYFGSNGIKYWNGTRDSPFALLDDDFTKTNYDDYINCQNQSLFQEPIHMILSSHNKHIRFMIPQLTLNSRLSDAMGVKLAHDTLARIGSTSAKLLPWLNLNINQLFYLTYTQSHCTKIPLTKFSISLYENTILPSRVRIFATTTNNKAFGELWNCPEASQLLPNFSCGIFPYLEYQSVVIETA
ncbi:neprilysin-1 [Microplitis demolitor]|uniref:neprilysin-1 n=1 Tax=Microplitis demolitor TaxID=69319 RepID=UPI00235B5FF3|nr:neprilysin-1 [Microplitis demolitor]